MSGTSAASSGVEFTVPGVAVPWARAGAHGKVHFTPAKQRKFMQVVRDCGLRAMNGRAPFEGPVEMSVLVVYPWPESWSRKRRLAPAAKWKISRPDGDNLTKLPQDALGEKPGRNGKPGLPAVAFRDDAQVASWHGWKMYGDDPRLHVRLKPLTE